MHETHCRLFFSFIRFFTTAAAFSGNILARSADHFVAMCDLAMIWFFGNAVMMASLNGFFICSCSHNSWSHLLPLGMKHRICSLMSLLASKFLLSNKHALVTAFTFKSVIAIVQAQGVTSTGLYSFVQISMYPLNVPFFLDR